MIYLKLLGLGSIGILARYYLGNLNENFSIPVGTLLANVIGCAIIGWVYWNPSITHFSTKLIIMVGFLGALTTFSGFALEVVRFLDDGKWVLSVSYLFLTNVLCLGAVFLGRQLAQ